MISPNVHEDNVCNKDGGCPVAREWRYKKSITISSYEGELQIPKIGYVD